MVQRRSTWVRPIILGGKRVKLPLNTHENMLAYFDKCQSLIKSVQDGGVKKFKDENIGIAITSGAIAHFRLGHHFFKERKSIISSPSSAERPAV